MARSSGSMIWRLSGGCGKEARSWWSWTGSRAAMSTAVDCRTRWPRHSTRERASPSRSRTETGAASRSTPPARRAALRRRRSRRRSFPSITRAARAPGATASARCSSTTNRSSSPIPLARWPRVRSTPGRSPATRDGAGCCARRRARAAFRSTRRGATSRRKTGASCCAPAKAATWGSFPSSSGSRRSATSNTFACSCGSISSPRRVPPATARGSSPKHLRCGSRARRSRRERRSPPKTSPPGWARSTCRRSSSTWRTISWGS